MKASQLENTRRVEARKFALAYVKNGGNQSQAAMEVRKLTKDSARSVGTRIMKRADVQMEIQKALDELSIDYRYVLNARQAYVEKGLAQLGGERKEKEPFVSPADVSKHLQGIETVLDKLGERDGNATSSSLTINLSLHNKSVKDVISTRKEVSSWLDNIINGEVIDEEKTNIPQEEEKNLEE